MNVTTIAFVLGAMIAAPEFLRAQEISTSKIEVPEKTATPRKLTGSWNFKLGGLTVEEGKDETAAAALYFNIHFDYVFAPWLRAHVSPALNLFSSRVQERYDDDSTESRIWLPEGYLAAMPSDYLEFHAGALNQGFLGSSMLLSSLRSFPGAKVILKAGDKKSFEASLIAQETVPTSHSLNTEREQEEKLPEFQTQSLVLAGAVGEAFKWQASGGHFRFSNLPAKVVYESRRIGNVGVGENVPGNRFTYEHRGWFGTGELCFCFIPRVGLNLEVQGIHNTEAPDNAADAYLLGIGPDIDLGDYALELRYERYFIESEATVAYYNKSRFGHTNRDGDHLEATLRFKKEEFALFAEVYNSEPINVDPNQKDLQVYFIGVESNNAAF